MSAEGPTQPTQGPNWMDAPVSQPSVRTGVGATKSTGLPSFVFFGLIIIAVAAAGFVGISLWGPDKEIKNRSHLATDPPAPTQLPSLPPEPSAAVPDPAAAPAVETAPAPTESAPPDPPKPKPRGRGKKR